jgi:actin-related protein
MSTKSRGFLTDAKRKALEEREREKKEAENEVVVIDIGSGMIKAGWAGEDTPRCVVPAVGVDLKGQDVPLSMYPFMKDDMFVGENAIKALHASLDEPQVRVFVNKPVDRSEIKAVDTTEDPDADVDQNWEIVIKIIEGIYEKDLNTDPSKVPLLLTVSPVCTKEARATLASKIFKSLRPPALCMVSSSVMSLFSTGRTTGIVLEVGSGLTAAVPVYEGCTLSHAVLTQTLAGGDCTDYLMNAFKKKGFDFTEQIYDVVRDIKEKLCAVQLDNTLPGGPDQEPLDIDDRSYELPDRTVIRIDDDMRYSCSEILFEPEILGKEHDLVAANAEHNKIDIPLVGVHQLCMDSIMKCDKHLRPDLFRNIVLAGGTTMLKGFSERIKAEMQMLTDDRLDLFVEADSQRKYASWIGASMYASLPTFHHIKYTFNEYRVDSDVVHRKWF